MGTEIECIAYTNSMRTMKKSYTRFLDIEARKHIRACVNVLWYIFYKKKTCMHFVIGDKRDKYKKKKNIVTRRGKIQAYRLLANE